MTEEAHRAILKRILGDGRGGLRPDAGQGQGAVAALRLEIARVARDAFGLTATIDSCRAERRALEDLQDEMGPGRLTLVLQGRDGRLGLAVYSVDLVLALLEWRLLGILPDEAPPERMPTRTDAAVLGDLTDPVLARFGAAVAEGGADWAAGYRQGAPIEDPRHLPLTLAPGHYHAFRVQILLGQGRRGGELLIALPEIQRAEAAASDGPPSRPWPEALTAGVLGAELSINAVLWRLRLPATEAGRLRPGDCLPLPAVALSSVRLEAPGGVPVAGGRLGQVQGDRAVKVETGPGATLEPGTARAAPPLSVAPPAARDDADGDAGDEGLPAEFDFPAALDFPAEAGDPAEPLPEEFEFAPGEMGDLPALP